MHHWVFLNIETTQMQIILNRKVINFLMVLPVKDRLVFIIQNVRIPDFAW